MLWTTNSFWHFCRIWVSISQNLPWESSHHPKFCNTLLHRRHREMERTLNHESLLSRANKGIFNVFKRHQAKKEGLWTLTHLSFVASRIGMITPVHGPAIKEHSYVTFVYCVTIPMMSLVRAITISKTQFNFNPCPPESSSKNLQQLNGSISLRWHFCAFIAVKLYNEQ